MREKIERMLTPPVAEKRKFLQVHHGIERNDDYAWLRDANWQEVMRDPAILTADIRAYLEAENTYTAEVMSETKPLQDSLFSEMKARIKEEDANVPAPDGDYAYFTDFVAGGQYLRLCRVPRGGGKVNVVLNGNDLALEKDYFAFGDIAWSPDHKLLAYAYDDKGSEFYAIHVRDMVTGADLVDVVPDISNEIIWAADGRAFYYVRVDESHRPLEVWRHVVGTAIHEDVLIYREVDKGFFVHLARSLDGRFLIIRAGDHETSEVHLLDVSKPAASLVTVALREHKHDYHVTVHGDKVVILTNSGEAEDYRLTVAPVACPNRDNWQELEPHRGGRIILEMLAFKDWLVWLEREEGLPRLIVYRWADGEKHTVAFDEEAYDLEIGVNHVYDTTVVRFVYSSMTTPRQVWDYDMASRVKMLRKEQEIPSGHNPANYITRRVMAPSWDGEMVPVSLLYRKDVPLDGTAPCLLYSYGAYGIDVAANFAINPFSLVDRGFVYAKAHIRGGKDKGQRWYTDGKMGKKTNTFKDFIAAANYLIEERVTYKGGIVAKGGSAGGMLMGAVANMAPELFAAIIAQVPFVDVLTTMLDDTLPLTPPEWPEWGNPLANVEDYRVIAGYSPYDNVKAQDYPAMLVTGGLTDPRVTYWEPAKWVAKLRTMKTDKNLLLLDINMAAGHGGASGRFNRLKEEAQAFAFALRVVENPLVA